MSAKPPCNSNAEAILAAHRHTGRVTNGHATNGNAASVDRSQADRADDTDDSSDDLLSLESGLAAANRKIESLSKINMALREEASSLAGALAKARRCAFHDELTGLPNRRLLQDHFHLAAARAARKHNQVALVFLDLNGFKQINDTIGHVAGDSLLREVATRLTSCIRSYDTACRFGGDEFVVLLPHIDTREQAIAAQEKIVARLGRPYFVDGKPFSMTASSGLALYPVDGENCIELLRAADKAMYREKASGATGRLPFGSGPAFR